MTHWTFKKCARIVWQSFWKNERLSCLLVAVSHQLMRGVVLLYQMLANLVYYGPAAARQHLWTWPLARQPADLAGR